MQRWPFHRGLGVAISVVLVSGAAPADRSATTDATAAEQTSIDKTTIDNTTVARAVPKREAPPTAVPNPEAMRWYVPDQNPVGLRLVSAVRSLVAGCGPTADCIADVPAASLTYGTDDATVNRSVSINQTAVKQDAPKVRIDDATEETIGGRDIEVLDRGSAGFPSYIVVWATPDGLDIQIQTNGVVWDKVVAIIMSLTVREPDGWANLVHVQSPVGRCLDAQAQVAPTLLLAGWKRFVLTAHPSGTCEAFPFLMISLGRAPAPGNESGTLVTIVTQPASLGAATATEPSTDPLTAPIYGNRLVFRVGTVIVDVHGNADENSLRSIAASIRPLSNDDWAELVAEIQPPSSPQPNRRTGDHRKARERRRFGVAQCAKAAKIVTAKCATKSNGSRSRYPSSSTTGNFWPVTNVGVS
jgi:hypothetical protein